MFNHSERTTDSVQTRAIKLMISTLVKHDLNEMAVSRACGTSIEEMVERPPCSYFMSLISIGRHENKSSVVILECSSSHLI